MVLIKQIACIRSKELLWKKFYRNFIVYLRLISSLAETELHEKGTILRLPLNVCLFVPCKAMPPYFVFYLVVKRAGFTVLVMFVDYFWHFVLPTL